VQQLVAPVTRRCRRRRGGAYRRRHLISRPRSRCLHRQLQEGSSRAGCWQAWLGFASKLYTFYMYGRPAGRPLTETGQGGCRMIV
jgi:hypothetical protein